MESKLAGKNFPKKFAVLFARASTAVRSGIDPRAVRSSASKVVESMVPKFIRSRRILTPVLGTVQRIMRPMRIRPIRDTRHGGFAFVASICRVDHCTLYCLCHGCQIGSRAFLSPVAVSRLRRCLLWFSLGGTGYLQTHNADTVQSS